MLELLSADVTTGALRDEREVLKKPISVTKWPGTLQLQQRVAPMSATWPAIACVRAGAFWNADGIVSAQVFGLSSGSSKSAWYASPTTRSHLGRAYYKPQ